MSHTNTKSSVLLISPRSEPGSVRLVEADVWEDGRLIHLISDYPEAYLLKQRDTLPPEIEPSSPRYEYKTPDSTFVSYSPPTTGSPKPTSSDIPSGQLSMDFSVTSESLSRTTGSPKPPTAGGYLPTSAAERKKVPLWSGLVRYFPRALAAVAAVSYVGSKQHHPDKPMHWDRNKSTDEEDTLLRHLWERGTVDTDGVRHTAKVAWRALAMLEKELEAASE